jgi:hypothetical protein
MSHTKIADGSNARGLDGFSISQVDSMEARPVSTFSTAYCLRKQITLKWQSANSSKGTVHNKGDWMKARPIRKTFYSSLFPQKGTFKETDRYLFKEIRYRR